MRNLPRSVQEIVEVIGRERALFLIGKLPRCYASDGSERVILYVPKTLKPNHYLVQILGWADATKMSAAFGGELLKPGNCYEVYRVFRDVAIRRFKSEGVPIPTIAEWFDVTERRVRQVLENPQELHKELKPNNTPTATKRKIVYEDL